MRLVATESFFFFGLWFKVVIWLAFDPDSLPWPWPISWMLHVSVHNFLALAVTIKMLIMFTPPPLRMLSLCRGQLCEIVLVCRGRNLMKWTERHRMSLKFNLTRTKNTLWRNILYLFVSLPHITAIKILSLYSRKKMLIVGF